MITVDQIRLHLDEVISGSSSLDDFDEWFAASTWNMHLDSAPEAVRFASTIELLLAEFDGGFRPEASVLGDLKEVLGRKAEADESSVNFAPQPQMAAASSRSR